jgi:hypothetical protein
MPAGQSGGLRESEQSGSALRIASAQKYPETKNTMGSRYRTRLLIFGFGHYPGGMLELFLQARISVVKYLPLRRFFSFEH